MWMGAGRALLLLLKDCGSWMAIAVAKGKGWRGFMRGVSPLTMSWCISLSSLFVGSQAVYFKTAK
jgi:hypothetical protein